MPSRREFLVSGAVVAAGANYSSQADAALDVQRSNIVTQVAAVGSAADSASTLTPMFTGVKNYPDVKARLATILKSSDESGLSPWLAAFTPALDVRTIQAVTRAGNDLLTEGANPRSVYEPQLIESLLASASTLLDQALAYRNELAALEIQGVSAAVQYLLSVNSAIIMKKLVDASSQVNSARVIEEYQKKAAAKYVDQPGAAAQAQGAAEVAKLMAMSEGSRVTLTTRQIDSVTDAQQVILKQLTALGGGQNFSQRYTRVLNYYLEDVGEAYRKCYCASLAIPSAFGIQEPLERYKAITPDQDVAKWANDYLSKNTYPAMDGSFLDALVVWCRKVLRLLEEREQNEIEYLVTVPAVQNWTFQQGVIPRPRTPIVGAAVVAAAMAAPSTGVITFNLTPDDLAEERYINLRVVGVGLSVLSNDTQKIFSAVIYGPEQKNVVWDKYRRQPTVVGRVRSSKSKDENPIEPEILRETSCLNMSPIGEWKVKMRLRGLSPGAIAEVDRASITEVFLHLRLRSTPEAKTP